MQRRNSSTESDYTTKVLQKLKSKLSLEKLFLNQMRLLQQRAQSSSSMTAFIEVPYPLPSTNWHLVGLPELDKQESNSEFSYYDGFQLFAEKPLQKDFTRKYIEGPLYENIEGVYRQKNISDESFDYNLVYTRASNKSSDQREQPSTESERSSRSDASSETSAE